MPGDRVASPNSYAHQIAWGGLLEKNEDDTGGRARDSAGFCTNRSR